MFDQHWDHQHDIIINYNDANLTAKVCWALIGEGNPRIPIHSHVEVIKTMDYEGFTEYGGSHDFQPMADDCRICIFYARRLQKYDTNIKLCGHMSTHVNMETLQNHVNVGTPDTANADNRHSLFDFASYIYTPKLQRINIRMSRA